ncbi:MAG: hypothetical protein WCT77_08400 [Bacteroidota bacterium]|jgi:hypothetical protein
MKTNSKTSPCHSERSEESILLLPSPRKRESNSSLSLQRMQESIFNTLSTGNNTLLFAIIFALFSFILVSCNGEKQQQGKDKGKYEAMNSGTITVFCDASEYEMLKPVFKMYDSVYKDVKLTVNVVSAREAMAKLLSGGTPAICIARDYLHDEDSLMGVYKVKKHERFKFAEDALVFFTRIESPLDTINESQIKDVLFNNKIQLKTLFKQLKTEPVIAIPNVQSSEYANFKNLMTKNKPVQRQLKMFAGGDSVRQFVLDNDAIGIGYLSQIARNPKFKPLSIGYMDSAGKYIKPHVVHQANIVQRFYPYIVNHYVYLLEDRRNLPWWFATFIAKEAAVQRYFKEIGIVPAYANFVLIQED